LSITIAEANRTSAIVFLLMTSLELTQQNDHPVLWVYLAPGLLLLAHIMSGIALLLFGARTGSYPLHLIGLGIYLATLIFAVVSLGIGLLYVKSSIRFMMMLVLISWPAFASLVFRAALWMTPWLGGASYAPWDPGDIDLVIAFNLLFAVLWAIVALLYGSHVYLLAVGAAQLLVYFATHALPQWIRYPAANPLGVRPGLPILLLGIFIATSVVIALRNQLIGQLFGNYRPTRWLAVILLTAAGGWVLYQTMSWLPANGEELGWTATTDSPALRVPRQAWDWTRPAVHTLVLAAVAAIPLAAIANWIASRSKRYPDSGQESALLARYPEEHSE